MYICLCNPFTDRDVSKFLESRFSKTSVSEVYDACSGGASPNCCSCIEGLKDMVRQHNSQVTVQAIGAIMDGSVGTAKEAA